MLEAPLSFAILAMQGDEAMVRWFDPAACFARYGNAALAEFGRELARICEAIVVAALGPPES